MNFHQQVFAGIVSNVDVKCYSLVLKVVQFF